MGWVFCLISLIIKNINLQQIIVSVTNDLVTDQRVHKVCTSLQEMNFSILLVGRKLKKSLPLKRNYKTHRIKLVFNKGFLFYAEYNFRLFFYLLFKKKNILLSNDLDTLLPNYLVSRLLNKKLVYDSHELFTEVPELVNKPKVQNFWLNIEKRILPKLKNTYTVCQSIANYYNKRYQTKFKVIRNIPLQNNNMESIAKPNKFFFDTTNKKIILYQGAINIGRGLELMIDTMTFLENYIFVIIGDGDIFSELQLKVKQKNLENQVKFIGKVKPSELKKITSLANLGISIEEDLGLNYRYALPNKIFDYIHANVPVLVSNLPEMKLIVENYQIGEVVTNRVPKELALQIENLLSKNQSVFKEKLQKATKELHWENEEKILKEIFTDLA